jgi:hypothetical protein
MTLAPLIDMINHASSSIENVSVARVEDALEIRAKRKIEKDEELLFSYHSASQRFWVCEYGFAFGHNEFDDLDLSSEIENLSREHVDWLENEGYWG